MDNKNDSGIIKREIMWKGQFLRCSVIKYRDRKGVERQWECVDRANTHGIVVIVPVTKDNDIILIKQYRPPLNEYVIEFPAGLCDKGEALEETAQRELLEETGYGGGELILLKTGPVAVSSSKTMLNVFLAHNLEHIGSPGMDENEDIEVIKTTVDNFYDHIDRFENEGTMVDLKIYGFLELAKRRLLRSETRTVQ